MKVNLSTSLGTGRKDVQISVCVPGFALDDHLAFFIRCLGKEERKGFKEKVYIPEGTLPAASLACPYGGLGSPCYGLSDSSTRSCVGK